MYLNRTIINDVNMYFKYKTQDKYFYFYFN